MKVKCKTNEGDFIEVDKADLLFRPQIYAVIINDNREVLLCPNWDGYDFPGGGIELGESNELALKREVFEETGLKVQMKKIFLAESSMYFHPNKKQGYHTILLYATATVVSGEISMDNLDTHERNYAGRAEWRSINNIQNLKFYNAINSVEVINKALNIKS